MYIYAYIHIVSNPPPAKNQPPAGKKVEKTMVDVLWTMGDSMQLRQHAVEEKFTEALNESIKRQGDDFATTYRPSGFRASGEVPDIDLPGHMT